MKKATIIGAIAGDVIGSIYEFNPTKDYNFALLDERMEITDDSIITIAVAEWLMTDEVYSEEGLTNAMRKWGRKYPCPMGAYGGMFMRWLTCDNPAPYNSFGNGSAMRVSAVGFSFKTLAETLLAAKISAKVTHNHPEGIKGAQATAAAIFMARNDYTKDEIRGYIEHTFGYDLHRSYDSIKQYYTFDGSCQGTVPEAIIAFLESDSYEDAIRKTVALGGDADTMGAITGAIAIAYYKEMPDNIYNFVMSRIPDDLKEIVLKFEGM